MHHIKKNRCRIGNGEENQANFLGGSSSENGKKVIGSQMDEDSEASSQDEEINAETLADESELFAPSARFVCTLCTKMSVFSSYVSMWRHRRRFHHDHDPPYGICSSDWLKSRKPIRKSRILPVNSATNETLQIATLSPVDYSYFIQNVSENLNDFLDGKRIHIRAAEHVVSHLKKLPLKQKVF